MARVGVLLTEILMLHVCLGYQIRGCETYVDVREDTETPIVCDGIGETHRMYWSVYSTNADEQTIGDCTYTLDCTNNLPDYEVSRSTNTSNPPADPEIRCRRYAIENTSHTCQCRPSTSRPGNPTPQVTWNQNPGSSELKLVNVQREDDGNAEDDGTEVKCTATNKMTTRFSAVASDIISLKYPPPAQPTITGLIEGQPLLEGTRLLITCVVQGGNPPVTSVNFWCGSHVDTADAVYEADVIGQSYVSSNISIDSVTTADNGTVCTCSAVWTPRPDFYRSNSTVTILIIEATSARVSQLTINNTVGDIIVNAGDNGSVILSCTPRLVGDSQTLGLPTNPLVVSNQESSMDLIAFPVPSTRSIVFLGTATPTVDSFEGSGNSTKSLSVRCQPDDVILYISRCTVRVSDSAANGFYRVTLGNQVGSAVFLIHLDLPKQEASSSVPVPAIAGGVGGAVVIIVIMIIVVVIVSRRKRELNKRKETTTKADDEEFEEHINPVYDMEDTPEDDLKDKPKPTAVAWRVSPQNHLMNDLEDGTPVEDDRDAGYSSLSLERNQQPTIFSSPDDDTYSSVDDDSRNIQAATNNRQQFNDQDAGDYAVVGAEGEERSTEVPRGDVYAVVDKTKKQQQPSDSTTPSLSAESSGNSGQTGDVYALIDKTKKRRQTSDNTSLSPATSAQSANTGIAGPNGDVYAQVNKNVTKDGNSVSGLGAGVEYDPYEDIEISSPESPSLVTDAQNMTTMQTTETDDEYNTLRFDNNYPARETAAGDTEYSHLGSV
ncbi:hypothetical protein BaRGS_00011686 [Batillaria attramentaria]|uniref:Ig-like domain-containing protein n=1 Tax=Batillaria attramentaria TaxID=370345 RepID=A0ABD0LCE2_9CAEN